VKTNSDSPVLYWGGRKSGKYVRCYWKIELGDYRVELELHTRLLRREHILTLDDLEDLPEVIYPRHVQFVQVDWTRLEQHISQRLGSRAKWAINEARRRASSICRLRRYLRKQGVVNFRRFVAPLPINDEIDHALGNWARHFHE